MSARFDWEGAGLALGESLGEYCALVVIGTDPVTTGRVAVGIARAQSPKRRVALGDLFAESPPIQELVSVEDPHGLVDSFLYGISLNRIAHEVPGAGQLYVMPSGTEPPDYEEILPNPRWHRLATGFREVGALLVLAVPASAPHIEDLVAATDGAILVGEAVPRKLPVSSVISSVREPAVEPSAPEEKPAEAAPAPVAPAKRRWTGRQRVAGAAGLLMTLTLAFVAYWLATRPISVVSRGHTRVPQDTARARSALSLSRDSAARDAVRDTTTLGPIVAVPGVTNPADSSIAAAFAVELTTANTQLGAIYDVQEYRKNLPATTFSPVLIQGAEWFTIYTGAFPTSSGADSLLLSLRQRGYLTQDAGRVVAVPFAFLIDSAMPAAVNNMMDAYARMPVYALRQNNGKAWLLVGAFATADQAALYAERARSIAGARPVLVYRKGRMF